jgi:hypothetical protein
MVVIMIGRKRIMPFLPSRFRPAKRSTMRFITRQFQVSGFKFQAASFGMSRFQGILIAKPRRTD